MVRWPSEGDAVRWGGVVGEVARWRGRGQAELLTLRAATQLEVRIREEVVRWRGRRGGRGGDVARGERW